MLLVDQRVVLLFNPRIQPAGIIGTVVVGVRDDTDLVGVRFGQEFTTTQWPAPVPAGSVVWCKPEYLHEIA
jgi:hypothetical protein